MSKYLLGAAAAALAVWSVGPVYATHSCPPGLLAQHIQEERDLITTETSTNQGFSSQPQHSPDGQGTSQTETTTTQHQVRQVGICVTPGNELEPPGQPRVEGEWVNDGDPIVETEIVRHPSDNAPGQN